MQPNLSGYINKSVCVHNICLRRSANRCGSEFHCVNDAVRVLLHSNFTHPPSAGFWYRVVINIAVVSTTSHLRQLGRAGGKCPRSPSVNIRSVLYRLSSCRHQSDSRHAHSMEVCKRRMEVCSMHTVSVFATKHV